jgi:hypothetical protein
MSKAALSEAMKERWRTAGRFADVLEAEVKARTHRFIARVVSWFNLCRVCQDLEEQLLLAEACAGDKQLHALLSTATPGREAVEGEDAETLRPPAHAASAPRQTSTPHHWSSNGIPN